MIANVQPTQYTVCALPLDHPNASYVTITVEWRGNDRWAVCDGRNNLGTDGEWDFEPTSSARTDEWLATHRFNLDTALRLAAEAAPHMTVNGLTVADLRNRGES